MPHLVKLMPRAQRDLVLLYDYISATDSAAAFRWYQGLRKAILSLEQHPRRCPMIPENKQLRHLLYGQKPHVYRVLYRVLERKKLVEVLHIRHSARRRLTRRDLL